MPFLGRIVTAITDFLVLAGKVLLYYFMLGFSVAFNNFKFKFCFNSSVQKLLKN